MTKKIILSLMTVLIGCNSVFAQEIKKNLAVEDSALVRKPRKEGVQAADTLKMPPRRVPTEIISKDEIKRLNYEDFGDILGFIPGINIRDLGSTGQLSTVGIRGSSGNQVLVLLDGRPLNDSQSGLTDLNVIAVEDIERVEIFKEGTFSLYGATAVGGVINISTENLKGSKPYSRVIYRKGYYGYSDVDAMLGRKITPQMDVFLGGILKNFKGRYKNSNYEAQKIRGKLKYKINEQWGFIYYILYNKSDLGVPGPISAASVVTSVRAHQKDVRYDYNVLIKRVGTSEADSLQAIIYHTTMRREYRNPDVHVYSLHRNTFTGIKLQHGMNFKNQTLFFGLDFEARSINSTDDGRHADFQGGVFVEDEISPVEWLKIRLLGRLDRYSSRSGGKNLVASPALNAYLHLNAHLTLFAGYRRAFRVPTFDELYWDSPYFVGNEKLTPEIGQSLELGIVWKKEDIFRLLASLYHRRVRDLIKMQPHPNNPDLMTLMNTAKSRFTGADLEFELQPWEKIAIGIRYSYLEAEDEKGAWLIDRPQQMAYGWVDWTDRFFDRQLGVTVRLSGRLIGKRWGMKFDPVTYQTNPAQLQQVGIFDVKLMFEFKDADIFYTLENILDKRYQKVMGYPMPGRTIRWGITWEFFD